MSVVWLVDMKRFLQEYHNHIRNTPLKFVNWLVDEKTGYVRMYITTSHGEIYCYIHKENIETIPLATRQDLIKDEGRVFGTIKLKNIK